MNRLLLLFFVFFGSLCAASAQGLPPQADAKQVDIIYADHLDRDELLGRTKLTGNVHLVQGTTALFCNLAIKNDVTNVVEAYGNVRIIQADSVTIRGDSAIYYGNTRQSKISGRTVTLRDGKSTVRSKRLDYDLNSRIASYRNGGTVEDGKSTLRSREAFYNTATKLADFYGNVRVNSPETDVISDTLRYSTYSKDVYFLSPSKIISKSDQPGVEPDTVNARSGTYNLDSRVSNFVGRSSIKTAKYTITGDTLRYDTPTQIGIARGHVVMVALEDSTRLTGQEGRYNGVTGRTRVWGRPLMERFFATDTLLLRADTLTSLELRGLRDTTRHLLADGRVQIFRRDFQAVCDSLAYNVSDSTMNFYQKPVLWNTGNQSEADSVIIRLVHNKINTMYLLRRAFVISTDTLGQFNQVKGRKITAYFNKEAQIHQVLVEGNGESLYHALNDDRKRMGMNYVQCGRMRMNFDRGAVQKITFLGRQDGVFYPPGEVSDDNNTLDGFMWKKELRPTRQSVRNGTGPAGVSTPPLLPETPAQQPRRPLPKKTKKNR